MTRLNRNSSKDSIFSNSVYNLTENAVVNNTLRDDNGNLKGKYISAINQDSSINIADTTSVAFEFISAMINGIYSFDNINVDGYDFKSEHYGYVNLENNIPHTMTMHNKITNKLYVGTSSSSVGTYVADGIEGITTVTITIDNNRNLTVTGNKDTVTFNNSTYIYLFGDIVCCVTYDTSINYFDGSTKRAENVKVGDKLLGYNETIKQFVEAEVLGVTHKLRNDIVTIKTENHEIRLTPDHPILTDQGWAVYDLNAKSNYNFDKIKLDTSMSILTKENTYEKITSIDFKELEKPINVYTFNVTDTVDTFVAADLVLHNAPDQC